LNPLKNGPGIASTATTPAGRFGGVRAIGILLGPVVRAINTEYNIFKI